MTDVEAPFADRGPLEQFRPRIAAEVCFTFSDVLDIAFDSREPCEVSVAYGLTSREASYELL